MSTMGVYHDNGRAMIGTPPISHRDGLTDLSSAPLRRTAPVAGQGIRAAGRAIVRWYRAGQLGGGETLRAGRWAGGRC